MLWNCSVPGKLCTAAWTLYGNTGRKSGIPHSVLHIAGSNSESVFEEDMWLEYMAWNSYSCGGALSALYEQLTVISEQ